MLVCTALGQLLLIHLLWTSGNIASETKDEESNCLLRCHTTIASHDFLLLVSASEMQVKTSPGPAQALTMGRARCDLQTSIAVQRQHTWTDLQGKREEYAENGSQTSTFSR